MHVSRIAFPGGGPEKVPVSPPRQSLVLKVGFIVVTALAYALLARLAFAAARLEGYYSAVSISFIFLMPVAFGAIAAYLGYRLFPGRSWFWSIGAPPIVVLLGMVLAILAKLEAALCVLVAAPVVVPCAILGGLLARWFTRERTGRLEISLLALLPFAVSPIEEHWAQPQETVSITDSVHIAASPAQVWQQIVSVPAIDRGELPSQWIYLIDFPRPIAAVIDREGLGARRHATFERGVSFFEIVHEWVPQKSLAFSIEADPDFIPHTAFDQHIIVGGRFYDVLDGRYEIQPIPGGSRLVLTSTHRLSTRFNWYTGLWSEWVMNQIQGSILTVIKHRAEAAHG